MSRWEEWVEDRSAKCEGKPLENTVTTNNGGAINGSENYRLYQIADTCR